MKKVFFVLISILVVVACKKKEDDPIAVEPDPYAVLGAGVYDYDSNFYQTVKITGAGEWMAENLKACHFSNGDTIPSGIKTADIGGMPNPQFFFYPNGDSSVNLKKYGRLYTYYVVEDGRNVCPTGYHVPTKNEWDTLTKYVGGQENGGGKLKSTSYWLSPNFGADNESLFNGLPAGYRAPDSIGTGKHFYETTKSGIWWTSTADTADRVWTYYLKFAYSNVFRTPSEKNFSYSVRCKKD
ncbi:MAG: fibrobacter succinogenes major paralogous domain-containing protein [Bacteroidota bacterium]